MLSGREGIRTAQQIHLDLILMDIWMPVFGGAGALQELKHDPTTAHIRSSYCGGTDPLVTNGAHPGGA